MAQSRNHNWQEDRLQLGLSDDVLYGKSGWIDEMKKYFVIPLECDSGEGVPMWE